MRSLMTRIAGVLCTVCAVCAFSDIMEDYTFTDVDGKSHHLYGYLNQNKWVALFMTKPGD